MDNRTFASRCYDWIKVVVTVLVVIGHTAVMYTPDGAFSCVTGSRALSALTRWLYLFHMPVFFAVSGCVFSRCLAAGKYRRFLPFIGNKAKRLLVPYLFFGCLLVAPVVYLCGLTSDSLPACWLKDILLGSQPRHLWYLLSLFWMFLLAYLGKPLAKKPLLLLAAAAALYIALYRLLPVKLFGVLNLLQLRNTVKYLLYFFLGMVFDRYFDALQKLFLRCWWLLLLLPAALCGSFFIPETALGPYSLSDFTNPVFAALGCLMCLGCAVHLARFVPGAEQSRVFLWLKRNSFGIYLFHAMLIYIIYYFMHGLNVPAPLMAALVPAVVIPVSGGLTELLRKLRLRFALGESAKKP